MDVKMYNIEFWRWYLQNEYEEFQYLDANQTLITRAENIFDHGFDLDINLEKELCFDSSGNRYSLPEYIAVKNECDKNNAKVRIDVEYERWKGKRDEEQANLDYYRDIDNYRWYRRKEGGSVVVTEFDLILESIVEMWNADLKEWERSYEGKLRYLKFNKVIYKPFKFDPSQTHSVEKF